MIYSYESFIDEKLIGSKANNLQKLYLKKFNVPKFIVLDNETLEKIENGDNTEIELVTQYIEEDKKYAIRSSGINEDLKYLSFAGMYDSYLGVLSKESVIKAIKDCYGSRKNKKNIEYCKNNKITSDELKMAVIVQEMVEADLSLIAFSVNVLTGKDTELLIEATEGLGDKNANGEVKPECYVYDWYKKELKQNNNKLLSREKVEEIAEVILNIQQYYGYPVDLELAIENEKIWVIQARTITKILHSELTEQWTTANFKDGGVSATVCYPLLWSLYEKVYDTVARKFFLDVKIYKENEIAKQIDYFFCRPYWNVTSCKNALSKLPGFVEKDYDDELGVKKYYEGKGRVSNLSISDWINSLKIIKAYLKIVNEQKNILEEFRSDMLIKYKEYFLDDIDGMNLKDIQESWKKLIEIDYLTVELTYFWQVFINIVKQTLFKKKMLKYFEYSEYLNLLSGIKDISHTKPMKKQIEIMNKIKSNEVYFKYWSNNSVSKITNDYYKEDIKDNGLDILKEYIDEFGYHSDRELDITYKCYYEDIEGVITKLKNSLESLTIEHDFEEEQYLKYEEQMKKVSSKKIKSNINDMRKFLWWREELKDLSIRYYCLIKKYTDRLAKVFEDSNIVKDKADIYYLKQADILDFIDEKIDISKLNEIIAKNKIYYNSFKNFNNPTDIGSVYTENIKESKEYIDILKGVGCNDKIVTGKVKVIEKVENIDSLTPGDILVTKYIDTGWTSRFGILKGVISEYGGVLCHSSIVAREYGISAIVCAKDVCNKLTDGDIIEMNGKTGEIKVLKEGE